MSFTLPETAAKRTPAIQGLALRAHAAIVSTSLCGVVRRWLVSGEADGGSEARARRNRHRKRRLPTPIRRGSGGGTFVFYWWHRLRHANGFWQVFHQVHHSPTRIEVLTSFYKHPVEIASNTVLSASILYGLLGVSLWGAYWFNFFAATAEYFYHANFRSPHWLRYFIQTPELHSIHHQLDVHTYNFSDLPLWDRLFGTYKDTTSFAPACGFPRQNERYLGRMLAFQDVYEAA